VIDLAERVAVALAVVVVIASTQNPSWLFFLPLAQQAALLKDDLLDPVDQFLEDPELVALVRQCLATRCPNSTRTGRIR
jgi:hypothetical protein